MSFFQLYLAWLYFGTYYDHVTYLWCHLLNISPKEFGTLAIDNPASSVFIVVNKGDSSTHWCLTLKLRMLHPCCFVTLHPRAL